MGPGAYKTGFSIENTAMEHHRANSDGNMVGQDPQSFLTKTKRGEFWRNEGETPYTKQTYHQNPGPGQYSIDKKRDTLKNKVIQEETVQAAFNSSDIRDVNKKIKSPNPGPGTYIDINNPFHSSIKSVPNLQD